VQGVIASQELKSTCKQRQSLAILVLMLYTIAMLKRGNGKTYRLYKKDEKSFAKAPCEVLDIKYRIGQNSQLHSFFYTPVLSFFLISLCMYKEQNGFSMNLFYYINNNINIS